MRHLLHHAHGALGVHIQQNIQALFQRSFHRRPGRAIAMVMYGGMLQKVAGLKQLIKLFLRDEGVMYAILLIIPWRAGGGADGKNNVGIRSQKAFAQGALARSRGAGHDDQHALARLAGLLAKVNIGFLGVASRGLFHRFTPRFAVVP